MTASRRIIVIGASGVGKTTLVDELAPLLSLPVIPELARVVCAKYGHERIGDIPGDKQEQFKFDVLASQIQHQEALDSYISDRSTVDAWVLWQRWNICSAMTYDSERFYQTALASANTYTHVIYVPPSFAPVDDGFRWTDGDYQKQIDRLIKMTLFDFELWSKTLTLKSVDIKARVKEAADWILSQS